MNQVWGNARRRRRLGRRLSDAGIIILLPVLFCAVSILFWRSLIIDTERTVADQIDYEDAALCAKFGFASGTERHEACKLDLLEVRHSAQDLMARTSLP